MKCANRFLPKTSHHQYVDYINNFFPKNYWLRMKRLVWSNPLQRM